MPSKRRPLKAIFFPVVLLLALIIAACSPARNVTSVTTTLGSSSLVIGDTTQAHAAVVVTGGASEAVTWASSESSVATVSASGLVTATGEGTTTITATSTADTTKSGTATLTVSPKPSVTSVTITVGSSSALIGDTLQAHATVVVAGGASQAVTWASSDTSVATIDDSGLVTAMGEGTTTITATSTANTTKSGTTTISVAHPLAGRSVLYYVRGTSVTDVAQAALDAATAAYGLDVRVATAVDFVSALADLPDLVVYMGQAIYGFEDDHQAALLDWVADGGYATFTHWEYDGSETIAVAAAFQASFDGTSNHASMTVNDPKIAAGLSSPTVPLTKSASWTTYNVGLDALPGGEVIATHDEDGSAAIVSGNDGRTMMIGFTNDVLSAEDALQVYTNIFSELMRNRFHAGL